MSAAAVVEFRDAHKRYPGQSVLEAFSLRVNAGEKLALIGPSGSGKSTVLRLIMGLDPLDAGELQLFGQKIQQRNSADQRQAAQLRRRVGMVFQQFNLFPHLRVIDNLCVAPVHVLGREPELAQARARELLEQVGMADKAEAWPAQLSGGQKQRVAIARALAMDPELMLFDEVTSALDPEMVGEVLGVLGDLATHSAMSMLLATHEMRFAAEIADRVVFMDGGKVVEQGAPEQVLRAPTHARTQSFLASVLPQQQTGAH